MNRACIRKRISKGRKQPLVLHADNGNAMRAATLESCLGELEVLRSFSQPRVSNDTRIPSRYPEQPSTGLTTRDEHSPELSWHASGWSR